MIGTVFAVSMGLTVSHYLFDGNRNFVTCLYLMMVVVSIIGVSEFGSCLGEQAVKWIGIATVATYFHFAAVHFLTIRKVETESRTEVLVNEATQDWNSFDKSAAASFKI